MRRLELNTSEFVLAATAATLALPPGEWASVLEWNDRQTGCVPEFELEVWAEEAVAVTAAILYGARSQEFEFDVDVTSVTHGTETFTLVDHGLLTGDGPGYLSSTLTVPAGSSTTTPYYVIKVDDDNFKLALSLSDALDGTNILITGNGTGVITFASSLDADDPAARLYWSTHDGPLGPDGDGALDLAPGQGYSKRIPHSPRVVAYALVATLDTGAVSASLYPIQDR